MTNLKFTGYLPKEELQMAYSSCDLFFFPSYEETEGIVADSVPEKEYTECINKAKAVVDALKLAEEGEI